MVPEPTTLAAGASAQEAGRCFADSGEVRAIFVTEDDGRLRRRRDAEDARARGRRGGPRAERRDAARDRRAAALHARRRRSRSRSGFRFLEEQDLERVPVVEEGGRLVGVLSRAVVQRRLAEDEPPEPSPDPGSLVL